jgi:pyruvate dehydrogenase E1 component beta subunit/2-oxoisovalerate dehydrogenase E1 component beta subunit
MSNVERNPNASNDERCRPSCLSFVIRHSGFVILIMSITYLEAIRAAQAKVLRDDDRVFIYGQDVGGAFGGAFKATKGLAKEFPERVLNTPISEDAIVGTAIGAAIQGMRPIVEMQFADFSSIALNQILNNAGTHYWRTGMPVPITVRLPSGGTKGSGPFHSQSMESLYAHYPGLIVMTPATVEDAYTMLIEAVAIDDPCRLLRTQISLLPPQGRQIAGQRFAHWTRTYCP